MSIKKGWKKEKNKDITVMEERTEEWIRKKMINRITSIWWVISAWNTAEMSLFKNKMFAFLFLEDSFKGELYNEEDFDHFSYFNSLREK